MTSTLEQAPAGAKPAKTGRKPLTERDRAERRLGLMLVAPAVIVMLAVTAYPLIYSIWLSLQRYNLRFPDDHAFVGLSNYGKILSSSIFWQDMSATFLITIISVAVELVIGMAFAPVMHRAIFGRRTVRTVILVPYGIITVVAAFAFQFAVSPDLGGFLFKNSGNPPLNNHWGSIAVI